MKCKTIKLLIYRQSYETLTLPEQQIITNHLGKCNECWQLQVRLKSVLTDISADQRLSFKTLRDEFIDRIYQKINPEITAGSRFFSLPFFIKPSVVVVATVLIFFVFGIIYRINYETTDRQVIEIMQNLEFYQNLDFLQNYELIYQVE